jgi:uncharacterized protein (DUF1778 family)
MNNDIERFREAWDSLKDSGHELDGLVEVKAKISKNPRDVISLRVAREELREIEGGAAAANENVSQFIRDAALARARLVAGAPLAESAPDELKSLRERLHTARELVDELNAALAGRSRRKSRATASPTSKSA